jgi:hypothetical protein
VDAQFTEEDGLFAITYNSADLARPARAISSNYTGSTTFTALFGEPTREETTAETGLDHPQLWEDAESGTVFQRCQVDGRIHGQLGRRI